MTYDVIVFEQLFLRFSQQIAVWRELTVIGDRLEQKNGRRKQDGRRRVGHRLNPMTYDSH